MAFIGMDHGTTGISFCIMSDDGDVIEVFKIGREESKKGLVSATEELAKRVDFKDVKLMAITYAMGDGINKILPTVVGILPVWITPSISFWTRTVIFEWRVIIPFS